MGFTVLNILLYSLAENNNNITVYSIKTDQQKNKLCERMNRKQYPYTKLSILCTLAKQQ